MRIIMVFLAAAAAAYGQSAPNSAWSGAWTTDVKNHYFGPVVGGVFGSDPVVQTQLDLTRTITPKTSATLTLWASKGFQTSPFSDFDDEVDFVGSVARKTGPIILRANGGIFIVSPKTGFQILVGGARVIYPFKPWLGAQAELSAKVDGYWLTHDKPGVHGGYYPGASAKLNQRLTQRFGLVVAFAAARDANGAFGFARAPLYYGETGLTVRLGESWTLTAPKLAYGGSTNDPLRPGRATYGVALTKRF